MIIRKEHYHRHENERTHLVASKLFSMYAVVKSMGAQAHGCESVYKPMLPKRKQDHRIMFGGKDYSEARGKEKPIETH